MAVESIGIPGVTQYMLENGGAYDTQDTGEYAPCRFYLKNGQERVKFHFPNCTQTVADFVATDYYKARHPLEYEAFKDGTTAQTLLEKVEWLTSAHVSQLHEMHVFFLEDLASLDDGILTAAMTKVRDRARQEVAARPALARQEYDQDVATRIEKQDKLIAELQKKINTLEGKK